MTRFLTRLLRAVVASRVPAKWDEELDAAVARHPAGKRLTAGDPDPSRRVAAVYSGPVAGFRAWLREWAAS